MDLLPCFLQDRLIGLGNILIGIFLLQLKIRFQPTSHSMRYILKDSFQTASYRASFSIKSLNLLPSQYTSTARLG